MEISLRVFLALHDVSIMRKCLFSYRLGQSLRVVQDLLLNAKLFNWNLSSYLQYSKGTIWALENSDRFDNKVPLSTYIQD